MPVLRPSANLHASLPNVSMLSSRTPAVKEPAAFSSALATRAGQAIEDGVKGRAMAYKPVPGGSGGFTSQGLMPGAEEAQLQGLLLLPAVRRRTLPPVQKKESSPAQEMNVNPRFRPPSARTLLRQTLRAALIGLPSAPRSDHDVAGQLAGSPTDRPPALPGLTYIIRGLDVSAFPGLTIMTAIDRCGVEPDYVFWPGEVTSPVLLLALHYYLFWAALWAVLLGLARPDLRALAHAVRLVGLARRCSRRTSRPPVWSSHSGPAAPCLECPDCSCGT